MVNFAKFCMKLYSFLLSYKYPLEVKSKFYDLVQIFVAIQIKEISLSMDEFTSVNVFPHC